MKRILLSLSTLMIIAIMAVSCNKQSPKDVAATWLNSFYHMDYETAKKVSTEDTKKFISQLQQLAGMIPDSNKKEMKKINVTVKNVDEKGDTAAVTYVLSDMPDKPQPPLMLVKKDGKWLVEFTKNDQMGPADNSNSPADQPAMSDSAAAPPADNAMQDTARH